ncbi:RNA polymerase sigma factor [Prosthecomicrobium pneumaticum]|uniref:RNA polymerase sigma-70 factor (ECF subfamily) n=1 Tax=Prosthecomicrobium pneumaticum TaxID=81895 RepID=A0A7W9CUT8_9HYPH|nr:DUF6596 domain-containing protein [Prosthecomicrobium pneumaticum]MBB5752333.1 RNA polymerase sigma-70 factor (ECF subfamily) [Prosthecomicrobium pneumaticum]
MAAERARRTAEAVARHSYGKLVAFLAAATRDLAGAEDALAEAFATALRDWPETGCPDNPEAWLLTVARRRMVDAGRRSRTGTAAAETLRQLAEERAGDTAGELPDRRLALLFACAHPAIDAGIRAPLMLQTVLGLDAAAIASAFLTSPAAMAKRLVRAKEKIRAAGIPFAPPGRDELAPRLAAVLDAIYAAFAEGWSDPAGTDPSRRDLPEEALFLARLMAELMPDEPEALGLAALMLHAEARRPARRSADGDYIPLEAQNPALWDGAMIAEAERLLRRAASRRQPGRYQIEAALQSAHADRRRSGRDTSRAVAALYEALFALTGSPVVGLNRAVAIAGTEGPQAGLALLDGLAADGRLATYQPYWAARAALLAAADAVDEAVHAYEIAIGLAADPAVRRFLETRRQALQPPPPRP